MSSGSRAGKTRLHPFRVLRILYLKELGYNKREIAERANVEWGTVRSLLYRHRKGTYKGQRARMMARQQEQRT